MSNLLAILTGRAKEAPVGSGIARKGVNTLSLDREYTQHVADSIESDKEPMTKEAFKKSREALNG